ncbi:hypothetical protein BVC80_1665g73 [Macleaya cordata]|uniref:Kelch repeat type 1 n=1 Tax=Macleaya cordata TaxID=56857 RepID=A0A200RBL8_MACCD|nr:hypothetical protein BVC80_1665g73 [Macleaya cordata]
MSQKPKMCSSSSSSTNQTIFPGLRDEISKIILSSIPYSQHSLLKGVAKSWRVFLSSETLFSIRQKHHKHSDLICIFPEDPSHTAPYLFDLQCLSWCPLPPMPCIEDAALKLTGFISISLEHKIYVLGGEFGYVSFADGMISEKLSPSVHCIDIHASKPQWCPLAKMPSPRSRFACAANPKSKEILVAGGRRTYPNMSGISEDVINSELCYNVEEDEWKLLDGLPSFRKMCPGFFVEHEEGLKFLVIGGYDGNLGRRDGVVLDLKDGEKWKKTDKMLEDWGKSGLMIDHHNVAVAYGKEGDMPEEWGIPPWIFIFMLDGNVILRLVTILKSVVMYCTRYIAVPPARLKTSGERERGQGAERGRLRSRGR